MQHTSIKGCISPISDKYSFTAGVSHIYLSELKIYPNPATDRITIEITESGHHKVVLTDIAGKVIKEDIFIGRNHDLNFKVEKGIYQIRVSNENGRTRIQRLVVN